MQFLYDCAVPAPDHQFIDQELVNLLGGKVYHDSSANQELKCKDQGCPCKVPKAWLGKEKTFVEIGAYNGRDGSNTKFVEDQLGWRGLCVEPSPINYEQLQVYRPKCIKINGVVSNMPGPYEFFQFRGPGKADWHEQMSALKGSSKGITDDLATAQAYAQKEKIEVAQKEVKAYRFKDLFKKHKFTHIDLFSLDAEGAEMSILQTIDFDKVYIRWLVTEAMGHGNDNRVYKFLVAQGFREIRAPVLRYRNTYDTWFGNTRPPPAR